MNYRLYFFDRYEHIRQAVAFDAADDEEAIGLVADHADGRPMELWYGARRVAAFPAESDSHQAGPDRSRCLQG